MMVEMCPSFPSPQFSSSPVKPAWNTLSHSDLQHPHTACPSPIKPATPLFRAHSVQVICRPLFHSVTSCNDENSSQNSHTKIGLLTFVLEGGCISELEDSERQGWCSQDRSLEPSLLVQDSESSLKNRYPHLYQSFLPASNFNTEIRPTPRSTRNQEVKRADILHRPSTQKKRVELKGAVKSVIKSLRRQNKKTATTSPPTTSPPSTSPPSTSPATTILPGSGCLSSYPTLYSFEEFLL